MTPDPRRRHAQREAVLAVGSRPWRAWRCSACLLGAPLAREELPRCPLCGRVEGGEVPTSAGLVDVMAAVERGREWRPEGGPERWEAP